MNIRAHRIAGTALSLGGLALVAACASGGNASTPHTSTASTTGSGQVVSTASVGGTPSLVSPDGHTLYMAKAESAGHLLCLDACTSFWKPVAATAAQARAAGSAVGQTFTVVGRPGGGTQLVYDGHPLYAFTQEGPHQMSGNGVADDFGGTHLVWSAATVGGTPGPHPSMGSKPSDAGSGSGGRGYGY